jgi:hypothetical protein
VAGTGAAKPRHILSDGWIRFARRTSCFGASPLRIPAVTTPTFHVGLPKLNPFRITVSVLNAQNHPVRSINRSINLFFCTHVCKYMAANVTNISCVGNFWDCFFTISQKKVAKTFCVMFFFIHLRGENVRTVFSTRLCRTTNGGIKQRLKIVLCYILSIIVIP